MYVWLQMIIIIDMKPCEKRTLVSNNPQKFDMP